MKIRFYANACASYEASKQKLLSDPWLIDGAFEGSWFHYPPLVTKPQDLANVDYLYLSHLHPDHYDPQTLKHFRKDMPIVILNHGPNFLERILIKDGFTNLIKLKDKESTTLGPFTVTMYAPFVGNPFFATELGNMIDSALLIEANGQKCLNTNDNTPDLNAVEMLTKRHGKLDCVQLNYNAAGPYPACFENLSKAGELLGRLKKSEEILKRNLENMTMLANAFDAKYTMPFAGAYVIGGKFWERNAVLGTTTQDVAAKYLKNPILLNEGSAFDLTTGKADKPYTSINPNEQFRDCADVLSKARYPYEVARTPLYQKDILSKLLYEARANLWKKQKQLNCFPDWNICIKFYGKGFCFNMRNTSTNVVPEADIDKYVNGGPNLVCDMHPNLLHAILEMRAHWNNAEIGCHITFWRRPDNYCPDLHTLMSFFNIGVSNGREEKA